MSWYVVKFSADDIAFGREVRLRKEFDKIFSHGFASSDTALFSETKDGVTYVYFSPAAARRAMELVLRYWGSQRERPAPTTGLLVGFQDAVKLLIG